MIKPDDNLLEYVDDYVHGVLVPGDARIVEEFCRTSPQGQAALEQARRRREALRDLPPTEAPEWLIQKTVAAVQVAHQRRGRRWKYYQRTMMVAVAAVLLAILSLQARYHSITASPWDVRLLGQSDLRPGSQAAVRVAVRNVHRNRPVSGIPVEVRLLDRAGHEEVLLANTTTDIAGIASPQFTLPDWKDGQYELEIKAATGTQLETLTEPVRLRRDWRLMVTTDKPVYQPGQTILFRSLALRRLDNRPVAETPVLFTLTDPQGNMIFKHHAQTSRFGIAAAECPLADEIVEGEYRIRAEIGSTTSIVTVRVEKYVLPKFQATLQLDQSFYTPGDVVRGELKAEYFFGQPVANADIDIEVEATEIGPTKWASLQAKTGEDGRVGFSFPLPDQVVGREQESGLARFFVTATVTDTAGQQYSVRTSRVLSAQPIRITVVPENGSLVQGISNRVFLLTHYPDGQPAMTSIELGSDPQVPLRTDPRGVALWEVTPDSPVVRVSVDARDAEGRRGDRTVQLDCGTSGRDFLFRLDQAVYAGGDTVRLMAWGGGQEPVLVDWLKDGQTILSGQIEMRGGSGQWEVDLPVELAGTLEVVAYRFGQQGLPVRKSQTVLVRPAGQVNIEATLDHPEYRPGSRATIQFTLRDPQGKPAPGALSVKGVDEAVYSVLPQRAGREATFFLLEQELLEPLHTIYPDWPGDLLDGEPAEGQQTWQQALLASIAAGVEGKSALPAPFAQTDDHQSDQTRPSGGRSDMPSPATRAGDSTRAPAAGQQRPSPFTMAAASYPEKARQVAKQRREFRSTIFPIQLFLAVGLLVAGAVGLALFRPRLLGTAFLISLPAGLVLCGLLLPATTARRESARALYRQNSGGYLPEFLELRFPSASPPRVRQWFPETLFWHPELITDDEGRATLEIDLADSITTWRVTSNAVTANGQLGGSELPLRVFQPFFVDLNLPVSLTRNDEVAVPVVVYNYTDQPLEVSLELVPADWYRRLDDNAAEDGAEQESPEQELPEDPRTRDALDDASARRRSLALGPREVRSVHFPIRATRVGRHSLEVTAAAEGVADAIRREVEVVPDGQRVEHMISGMMGSEPVKMAGSIPEEVIEGSLFAEVKFYPSSFSQVMEGLESIFQMPYGCFEQTSSTTYPNILALDYLRQTERNLPEVEARARSYIHLGYQRLLGFEVAGGGFEWFGNPPANSSLTAYGLMQFRDMARVHDVDPNLIRRTRQWLLSQRRADGTWQPDRASRMSHFREGDGSQEESTLRTTAYIAWATFGDSSPDADGEPTREYLLSHQPERFTSPYSLALWILATRGLGVPDGQRNPYVARLEAMKKADGEDLVWWELEPSEKTAFYGRGMAGNVETTALATLALLEVGQFRHSIRGALDWLVQQKDTSGTWHSTQATVLSLKALVAGSSAPLGTEQDRSVELYLGDQLVRELVIPSGQSEVMQRTEVHELLAPGQPYSLRLVDSLGGRLTYQVNVRYHLPPVDEESKREEPTGMSIDVAYDRQQLEVDDMVTAVATVQHQLPAAVPMVIVDLPVPSGFAAVDEDWEALVAAGEIARSQFTPRQIIVYLRQLEPGQPLQLRYRLRATMPVRITVPEAVAYEYYNPAHLARGGSSRLEVEQRRSP